MSKPAKARSPIKAAVASLTGELRRIRERIAELKNEAERIATAPVERGTAIERLDKMIRDRAAGWHFATVRDLVDPGRRRSYHHLFEPFEHALINDYVPMAALEGLLFAVPGFAAALREWLVAGVDAFYARDGAPEPLTAEERAAKLAKVTAELFELERVEESLIDEAESEGIAIERRDDADPVAVLGIEEIAA